MFRSLTTIIIVCLLVLPAWADPDADMGEFMKRPAYRASYESMLAGQTNLPKWMATPDTISDSTTLKITKHVIDGQDLSVLEMCKPDQCENTGLIVMFSVNGDSAKGFAVG